MANGPRDSPNLNDKGGLKTLEDHMIRFAIVPLVALDIVERMLSRPVDRRIHESETTRDRHQYDTCHADGTVRQLDRRHPSVVARGRLSDR
jgi:hypothetical protein